MIRAEIKLKSSDISDKIKELVNGKIAILRKCKWSGNDDDYVLYGFEDDELTKAFYWELEQDELFGTYKDYDKFSKDYDNGEYDTCFSFVIKQNDFEILEEIDE